MYGSARQLRLENDICDFHTRIADGVARITDAPGLGIRIDRPMLVTLMLNTSTASAATSRAASCSVVTPSSAERGISIARRTRAIPRMSQL